LWKFAIELWSRTPSAAPDTGHGERHCATPLLVAGAAGQHRFGRAALLPQLTLYANDALSQLIQREEQLAPTHRKEKRI
jgi:hypothetical protein